MTDHPEDSEATELKTPPVGGAQEYYRRLDLEDEDPIRKFYRHEAVDRLNEFKERFIVPLVRLRSLPTDCLIFANGYGHLIGCYAQKDIVERHREAPSAKSNVSKYVKQYSRQIKLPPISGQRDESACNNMGLARTKQLQEKNEPSKDQ